jgi:hypothetical protein
VRVSYQTYKKLKELTFELRRRLGRPVSIDEVIYFVVKQNRTLKPSDFAGTWAMTDEEEKGIFEDSLQKMWKKWKP